MPELKQLLLSHLLGDVSGSGYEFRHNPKGTNFQGVITEPISCRTRWQGYRTGSLGQPTDDTEMTIALLRVTLMNNKPWNYEAVVKKLYALGKWF